MAEKGKGQARGSQEPAHTKGAKKGKGKVPEEDAEEEEVAPDKGAGQKGQQVPKGEEKGQEEEEAPPDPPGIPRDENIVGRPVFITPWGARFHTTVTCPTLANSGDDEIALVSTVLCRTGGELRCHSLLEWTWQDGAVLGRCEPIRCVKDATSTSGTVA
eukprot:s1316_g12.t1